MGQPSVSRKLASEPDFQLGYMTVSPSTGRVITLDEELRVEALTMAVLVTLARAEGATVTRDALVDECWQGRIVSDDAVARAIAKVRALERCNTPPPFALETVPKVGYRLLTAFSGLTPAPEPAETIEVPAPHRPLLALPSRRAAMLAVGLTIVVAGIGLAGVIALRPGLPGAAPPADRLAGIGVFEDSGAHPPVHARDFQDALLMLDEDRVRAYLKRGWNPNWKLDAEGNAALHNMMMACERNPDHDHDRAVRVARLLVEAGADPTAANKWNDTPLIIASARRYCGPDHPIVAYLKGAIAARFVGMSPTMP
ncbi:MAG: winged helix-turn-helix domain-containing protein [Caulobacterales bacterium]|nr:winged helix-turn-helix domain-containing protein [Caulobacterales bacterium]